MPNAGLRGVTDRLAVIVVTTAASVWSVFVWSDVVAQAPPVCVMGMTDAHFEKAIGALDGNIDLGLKLSVALLGGGGAILIGLKEGLSQTLWTRLLLIVALLFFAESALYGLWWRIGIAQGWLGECLNLVTEPNIARRYVADMNFFLAGLIVLALFVVAGIHSKTKPAVPAPVPSPPAAETEPPLSSLVLMAIASVLYLAERILRRSRR